ncbi:hypothetical protein V8C86DRAFT_2845373 [Haematococcus lacustris]
MHCEHITLGLALSLLVARAGALLQATPDASSMMVLLSPENAAGLGLQGWGTTADPCGTADCCDGKQPVSGVAAAPRCNWTGVCCRGWKVVGLDLSCGPRCTRPLGQLPGQLSALGALEALSLSGNQLGGPLPGVGSRTFVAGTPNLQVLDLSRNSFSGPLPSHYLTWTRLTSLNLSSNALTGVLPPSWGGMSTLTDLILDNNQLSGQMPVEWRALSPQSSGSLLLLNLQNNCALCGPLPPLPQGTLG